MFRSAQSGEDRYKQMTETPVEKLIPGLAVPTIISMLVTSVYNMADTFFVSQLGTSASGAVGIDFSLMAMIQAIGFTFGMGSGNYISRTLGSLDTKKAENIAASGFFSAILLGVVLLIWGIFNINWLVMALGATDTIAPYAMDYGRFILYAAPFMIGACVMNNLLRAQGYAVYSMVGMASGGILNIALDPILIFGFNLGISGAAIATCFSQFFSFCVLLVMVMTRPGCIRIKISRISTDIRIYGEILHAGFPSFCRQGLSSVATMVLNTAANPFGDAAIAAMSIVNRVMMFLNSAIIGFGQGFQPVCGFNFGAKKYDRVRDAFWFCVKVSTVVLIVFAVCCFIGAEPLIKIFRRDDAEVIAIGVTALRLQCITLPLQGWISMSNMLPQSIGYGFRAAIIASGRQGIFLIPVLLILPGIFGILGLQLCQPIADVVTALVSIIVIAQILNELKEKERALKDGKAAE